MKIHLSKKLAALAVMFAIASNPTATSNPFAGAPAYSQSDLEAQALRSITDHYALLVDPTLDVTRLKLVGTVTEGDRKTVSVSGRVAEITRFRAAALSYGTRVTGATVQLTGTSVEARSNRLELHATEDTSIAFEVGDRGHRPEDVTRQRIPHNFVFEFINGSWTLIFDRPSWPGSSVPLPDSPRLTYPTLAHRPDNAPGPGAKVLAMPQAAWGTYRWLDAVYYAHTYALSYNPAYRTYPVDCANFMSQALRAGGWTDKCPECLHTDENAWWYDDVYDQNTNTWSAADWLINFVYTSGRGYSLNAFTDLILGDLMFADWAYNGTPGYPEHSMMLTYKTSNNYGDIRFTYHTSDKYDYPLSLILANFPTPPNLYWGSRIQFTSN